MNTDHTLLRSSSIFRTVVAVFLMLGPAGNGAGAEGEHVRYLPPTRLKSGVRVLQAFAPVAEAARNSTVEIRRDGKTVALGVIIDADGSVITKASEVKGGDLMCQLANGSTVAAEWIGEDELNDVALLKIEAKELAPIEWAGEETFLGQWAVTSGLGTVPEAVGVVSVAPRRIPRRAFLGVELGGSASAVRVNRLMEGFGAEQAGVQKGDVIVAVENLAIGSHKQLLETLSDFRPGQTVLLKIEREGAPMEFKVRLMAAKADSFQSGFNRQQTMNRMGSEVSERAEGFELVIQHDSVLQPWQCGGPLLNLDGKAIGLNIARAGRVASYALPASLVKEIVAACQPDRKD